MSTLYIGESRFIETARIRPLQCVQPLTVRLIDLFAAVTTEKKFSRVVTFFGEGFLAETPEVRAFFELSGVEKSSGVGSGFCLHKGDWLAEYVGSKHINPFAVFAIANAGDITIRLPAITA